ncbi:MAG: hypothetical protein BJ554DRAFT_8394, partial [Olpidium bornovanus]
AASGRSSSSSSSYAQTCIKGLHDPIPRFTGRDGAERLSTLQKVEDYFEAAMLHDDRLEVLTAANRLDGDASVWWDSVRTTGLITTWLKLKNVMKKQFILPDQ